MGLYFGRGSFKYSRESVPNASNHQILESKQVGDYIAIRAVYPDCTNLNGHKTLVYKSNLINLVNQKSLDPHFDNDTKDYVYPIARFFPGAENFHIAIKFCEMMNTS